ncbi:uncharacterized protein LTHEOB_2091 [Neofusicoccum parvum]|uniref:Uncharacterized protein LTHEOB_2091 n=1 Tax=Neofusicoccum parvum TaxID=310453 RepID=A0ACB5RY15_9PEZI|nr:uncharacterized protein LTHEOB_2091 [Neofusicoccum parvum]
MLRLVQSIRHDLDRISNGTGVIPVGLIAQSDLDEVNSVIKQALGQIQGLEDILDGVGSPADAGKLKRSWRSLRAQNEILEKFQGILGLKDSLQVWLNRQTLLLSGRQA